MLRVYAIRLAFLDTLGAFLLFFANELGFAIFMLLLAHSMVSLAKRS